MTNINGNIYQKKGSPYYWIVLDYVDEQGKRKKKWENTHIPIKGDNKRLAKAKLKEVMAEFDAQKIDLSKDILFTVFMEEWLEILSLSIAESTYDGYKKTLEKYILPFFEPLKLRIRDIEPVHIQRYIRHALSSVSGNTVRKHMVNISKCLDSAMRQNIIAYNPAKRVDLPKKQKYTGAKFYNEKQIEHLLRVSKGDPLEIVILLTTFYGLRKSEVLGIKWGAIDFENNTIAIKHTVVQGHNKLHRKDSTKNDVSNSVIPLATVIADRLKQWRSQQAQHKLLQPNDYIDSDYVCTQIDGSLIKPHYVSDHFKRVLARNNLPHIRFHDLRHSSAGYLKYLGFDLKDIQTWLRHGDIGTTMNIYVHLDMNAKRVIADDLNRRFQRFGT